MQNLTATLLAAQKAVGDVLVKIVLSQQPSGSTHTYGLDTTNRILNLSHSEEEWSQVCQVLIDNRDGNLTALDLEGYSGVISYGYATSAGDEYKAKAPLETIAQKTDSMQGELVTTLSLAGVFNMMGEDEASVAYTPDEINTDTVKTILTAIANKTMSCFSHCKSYTITFDSEDSLIDSFTPKDYFSVGFKESRLSAFKKALTYTKCKAVVKDNSGAPRIHVFAPTISGDTWTVDTVKVLNDYVQPTTATNIFAYRCTTAGTTGSAGNEPTWPTTAGGTVNDNGVIWTAVAFDYEYNDAIAVTNHNFFDKSVRKRLVLPNKVIVLNHPDHTDTYSGTATDAASYAALNRYMTEYHYIRPISSAQCLSIAKAILQNYQLASEKGHGIAPMNVGQEVMDYVKITDSRASDLRIGNVGFINRWYSAYGRQPTRFGFEFRFGSLYLPGLAGTMPPRQITVVTPTQVADQWSPGALRNDITNLYDYLGQVIANQALIIDYIDDTRIGLLSLLHASLTVKNLNVLERLQGPMGTDMYT